MRNSRLRILGVGIAALIVIFVWKVAKPFRENDFESKNLDSSQEKRTSKESAARAKTKSSSQLAQRIHPAVEENYWTRQNRSVRFEFADVDLPMIFESEDLSDELRQVILADLDLIFEHFTGHSYFAPRTKYSFDIAGESISVKRGIQLDGKGAVWPQELHGSLLLVEQEGVESLVMSKEIVSLYKKAWDLRNENIAVFEKLENFINSISEASAENPMKREASELVWTPHKNAPQPDEIPNIVETFSAVNLRLPSLLEISENLAPQSKEEPSLSARTYLLDESSNIPKTEIILVYQNGSWKFVYGQLGT